MLVVCACVYKHFHWNTQSQEVSTLIPARVDRRSGGEGLRQSSPTEDFRVLEHEKQRGHRQEMHTDGENVKCV